MQRQRKVADTDIKQQQHRDATGKAAKHTRRETKRRPANRQHMRCLI